MLFDNLSYFDAALNLSWFMEHQRVIMVRKFSLWIIKHYHGEKCHLWFTACLPGSSRYVQHASINILMPTCRLYMYHGLCLTWHPLDCRGFHCCGATTSGFCCCGVTAAVPHHVGSATELVLWLVRLFLPFAASESYCRLVHVPWSLSFAQVIDCPVIHYTADDFAAAVPLPVGSVVAVQQPQFHIMSVLPLS